MVIGKENETIFKTCLTKARNLCSRQEKCLFEMRKKLEIWKVPENISGKILISLVKDKFIDEKRYAESFARSKFNQNKWGRIKIKYALKEKKIPEEIVSEALMSEIPEEDYVAVIFQILKTKNNNLGRDHRIKRIGKLVKYGTGKGFEYELVKQTVEKILKKDN